MPSLHTNSQWNDRTYTHTETIAQDPLHLKARLNRFSTEA